MRSLTTRRLSLLLALSLLGLGASTRAQPPGARADAPVTLLGIDVVYTLNADGTFRREETSRVRVNRAEAVQAQSQSYYAYSESLQRLEVHEAYTETTGGERLEVAAAHIVTQQSPLSTGAPAFSDVKVKAVIFPQIAPGAIKFARASLEQTRPLIPGHFSMVEAVPAVLEVGRARVTLVAPAGLPLAIQAIGFDGGTVPPDRPDQQKWVWTLGPTAAAAPEPSMIDPIDFSPRIAATTFPSFAAAADAYLEGAADHARVTPAVRAQAERITAGIAEPQRKAEALYHWVAAHIRYVALAFGVGGVVPRSADAVLATGYGDCKDQAALLGALLSAVGIDSSPVLVNARSAYWQPDIAVVPGVYDHVIVYVPSLDVYLDPTAEVAPFGVLPIAEAGKPALVTRGQDGGAGIVRLPAGSSATSTAVTTTTIKVAANGTAEGVSRTTTRGALDFVSRASLARLPSGQAAQLAATLMASFGQLGEGTLESTDPRDLATPLALATTFSVPNAMPLPAPGALALPLGVPGPVAIAALAREAALPAREHPFVCGAFAKTETTTFALPAGVAVRLLPPSVSVANRLGRFASSYALDGDTVRIRRDLVLEPPHTVCTPAEYRLLRELGQAVDRDLRAQLLYD